MAYSMPLDSKSNSIILIKLYKNVTNVPELRRNVLSGELNCCILKPKLILDPLQIVIAANKALITDKLKTRSLYTELLFNLSISKNISQSLQKFGIDDQETNLIVVVLKKINYDFNENLIFNQIEGEEVDLKELNMYSDLALITRAYKVSNVESKKVPLLDSVISRIATKDIISV